MTIILFILLMITLFLLVAVFGYISAHDNKTKEEILIVLNGFKEGLRGCGFRFRERRLPVERYKLILLEDDSDDICRDCLEATNWPAMDIADWMKEGFPKDPRGFEKCGGECACELIQVSPRSETFGSPASN